MALEQASRVGPEVTKFVDFDACFEAVYAFDVREREAVGLEKPEAEELVVEAERGVGREVV